MISSTTLQGSNGPFTPPRFSHVYLLKTLSEENSKGSWHGWEIGLEGQVEDINLYNTAKTFAKSIAAGDVKVKHTNEDGSTDSDDVPF